MTSFFQKVGLVAEKDVIVPVETKLGIMSSATKKSLQSYFATKNVVIQLTTGFNGDKFYAQSADGSFNAEFETYDELNAFVASNAANDAPAAITTAVDHQAEIDALQAQLNALQAKE